MKPKNNLKLRKVGDRYMLVEVSETDANVTTVYTLNETAAFLWNEAAAVGLDPNALAARLCEEYEVEPDVALADVDCILSVWKHCGLIV